MRGPDLPRGKARLGRGAMGDGKDAGEEAIARLVPVHRRLSSAPASDALHSALSASAGGKKEHFAALEFADNRQSLPRESHPASITLDVCRDGGNVDTRG